MSIAAAFIQFVPVTFLLSYVYLASAPAHNCDQLPHNVSLVLPSLGQASTRLGSTRRDSRFQLTFSCAVASTLFVVFMECGGIKARHSQCYNYCTFQMEICAIVQRAQPILNGIEFVCL